MTEYFTTSLGDYLSLMASKNGISKSELEKKVEIGEVSAGSASVIFMPSTEAEENFEKRSEKYDAVVDIKSITGRAILGLISYYGLSGTGVKLNLDKEGSKK